MTAARPDRRDLERRDLEARDARDRLAVLLNMEPGDLRRIRTSEALSMIEAIEAARSQRSASLDR